MALWNTSMMNANGGYRSIDHGTFDIHYFAVEGLPTIQVRRQRVQLILNLNTNQYSFQPVGSYEYLRFSIPSVPGEGNIQNVWNSNSLNTAQNNSGDLHNGYIRLPSSETPWSPVSRGYVTYRMWVKDVSHSHWGSYVTIHAFLGPSQVDVDDLKPDNIRITSEGNNVVRDQELAIDQPIRIQWHSPDLPSPHTGELQYQRVRIVRSIAFSDDFWNGNITGDIWGNSTGSLIHNGNPPRGFVDLPANRWASAPGSYQFAVQLEQAWDGAITARSSPFRINAVTGDEPPTSSLPLIDDVAPTITNPPNNSVNVNISAQLRLQWSFLNNPVLNNLSFDKMIVRRFRRATTGIEWDRKRLTRANPPQWVNEISRDSIAQTVSPDSSSYINIGENWGDENINYNFEIRLHSPAHQQAGLTAWTQLSSRSSITSVDLADPEPPTITLPVSSSSQQRNPDDAIEFHIDMPEGESGSQFRLRRRLSGSSTRQVWIEYSTLFGQLAATWLNENDDSILPTSASLTDDVTYPERARIRLGPGWQPDNRTAFYDAAYYQEGFGWTDYGDDITVRTSHGDTARPTIVSPRNNEDVFANFSLQIDYRDATGVTSDRVRVRRRVTLDDGSSQTQYWRPTSRDWTTSAPIGSNQFAMTRSILSGGLRRVELPNGWQDRSPEDQLLSISVRDNNVWSEWTTLGNLQVRAIVRAPTWRGLRQPPTGSTWDLTEPSQSYVFEIEPTEAFRIRIATLPSNWSISHWFIWRNTIPNSSEGQYLHKQNDGTFHWVNVTDDPNYSGFAHTSKFIDLPSSINEDNNTYTYSIRVRSGLLRSEWLNHIRIHVQAENHPAPTWITPNNQNISRHQSVDLQWRPPTAGQTQIELEVNVAPTSGGEPYTIWVDQIFSHRVTYSTNVTRINYTNTFVRLVPGWSVEGVARFKLRYVGSDGVLSEPSSTLVINANDNPPPALTWAPTGSTTFSATEPLHLRWNAQSVYTQIRIRRRYTIGGPPPLPTQVTDEYLAVLNDTSLGTSDDWSGAPAGIESASPLTLPGTDSIDLAAGWAVPGVTYEYYVSYRFGNLWKWSVESAAQSITADEAPGETPGLVNITAHTGGILLSRYLEGNERETIAVNAANGVRLSLTAYQRVQISAVIGPNDDLPYIHGEEIFYVSGSGISAKNINTSAERTVLPNPPQYAIDDFVVDVIGENAVVSMVSGFTGGTEIVSFRRYSFPEFNAERNFAFIAHSTTSREMVASHDYMYLSRGLKKYRVPIGNSGNPFAITDSDHNWLGTLTSLRPQFMGVSNDYVYYYESDRTPFIHRVNVPVLNISGSHGLVNTELWGNLAEHHRYFVVTNSHMWAVRENPPTQFNRYALTGGSASVFRPLESTLQIDRTKFSPSSVAVTTTTTPAASGAGFLNTGMLLYMASSNASPGNPARHILGAIDSDGNPVTMPPGANDALVSQGLTLPKAMLGDFMYYGGGSRYVSRTNINAASSRATAYTASNSSEIIETFTPSADNNYVYAVISRYATSGSNRYPITAELVVFQYVDGGFGSRRTVVNFSTAISGSGLTASHIRMRNYRIYADHGFIFLSFERYTTVGSNRQAFILRIPSNVRNSTSWNTYKVYDSPPGALRDPLRGLSTNPASATDTSQIYLRSSDRWLVRRDSDNTGIINFSDTTQIFQNPPYGVPIDPIITSWNIWVLDRSGRNIKKFSRLGSNEEEFTNVIPDGYTFTLAKWFNPQDWTPAAGSVDTGRHQAPRWEAPVASGGDTSQPYDQNLTVRWNNNLTTPGVTQSGVRIRRNTLGGGASEFLTSFSDVSIDWQQLPANQEVGPIIDHTSQTMIWPTPWQNDNTSREYYLQIHASDGEDSEWSEKIIVRTLEATDSTMDFNEGLVVARIGSGGGSATYRTYNFEGTVTNYTTNRLNFGVFQEPLNSRIDKVSHGTIDGTDYVYQLYGNPASGYEIGTNTRNRIRRLGFTDASVRADSQYQTNPVTNRLVAAITRNIDRRDSNFNKLYIMEFDHAANIMYIYSFDLPNLTNKTEVFSGTFFDSVYAGWWHMTVSKDYVYMSRNNTGTTTTEVFRVKTDGTSDILESFYIAGSGTGLEQITAFDGFVYGIETTSRNIVRKSESGFFAAVTEVASGNFRLFKMSPWLFWTYDASSLRLERFNVNGSNRTIIHQGGGTEVATYFDVYWPDDWVPANIDEFNTITSVDTMYLLYSDHTGEFGAIDYKGDEFTLRPGTGLMSQSTEVALRPPVFAYNGEVYFGGNGGNTISAALDTIITDTASGTREAYRVPNNDSAATTIYELCKDDIANLAYAFELSGDILYLCKYELPNFENRVVLASINSVNIFDYGTAVANSSYLYYTKRDNANNKTIIQRVATSGLENFEDFVTMDGAYNVRLTAAHDNYIYGRQSGSGSIPNRVFRIPVFGYSQVETILSGTNFDINARTFTTPEHHWQVDADTNNIYRYALDGTGRTTYTPIAASRRFNFSSVIYPHNWVSGTRVINVPTNVSDIVLNPIPDASRIFTWDPPMSTSLDWTINLQATLLNPDLTVSEDVTHALIPEECSVQYDASRRIRNTAVLVVNREIDWFKHKVKLTMNLTDNETGEKRHAHLGVYVVETVQRSLDKNDENIICQAYDLFSVLDTPIGFDYKVDELTPYSQAIRDVFENMGQWYGNQEAQPTHLPEPDVLHYSVSGGSNINAKLVVGTRVWMTNQSYTWLSVIETLAREANYRRPWITRDGVITLDESKDYTPSIVLPDGDNAVIDPTIERVQDSWSQPNQWIMIAQSADPNVPLPSGEGTNTIYIRTNTIADSFGSFINRGRRLVRSVQSFSAVAESQTLLDQTFEQQARRRVEEEIQGGDVIKFEMVPNPGFWHGDVFTLPGIVDGAWLVQKFNLPFDGSNMSVEAYKVITNWFGLV